MNEPPSGIRRWVTASTSTPTPMSTGSCASWVIQLAVIALRSSPAFDPTSASALGIFQVTVLMSSSVRGMPFRLRRGARYSDRSPGGVAEWLRQGPAKPCTPVRFRSPPHHHQLSKLASASCREERPSGLDDGAAPTGFEVVRSRCTQELCDRRLCGPLASTRSAGGGNGISRRSGVAAANPRTAGGRHGLGGGEGGNLDELDENLVASPSGARWSPSDRAPPRTRAPTGGRQPPRAPAWRRSTPTACTSTHRSR